MLVADTRAVLIGMGVILIVVGFLFSTLVCGVGVLFIILGLVIWQREEDDTVVPRASPGTLVLPGGVPMRSVRARRRTRAIRVAIVVCVVVLGAVGGYIIYTQLAASHFTGLQVSAPAGDCWSGTVGTGASGSTRSLGACGSTSIDLTCAGSMWVDLAKTTSGNWTLSVTGYRNGLSLGTYAVSGNLGVVRGSFGC